MNARLVAVLMLFCDINLYSNVIEEGKRIYSPDGQSYIFISEESDSSGGSCNYYNIILKNKTYKIENEPNPTYRLEWSKDGQSIFTMNHLPHEVVAQIYHFGTNNQEEIINNHSRTNREEKRWLVFDIRPPLSKEVNYYIEIYDWDIGDKKIKIFCRIIIINDERRGKKEGQYDYYIASYSADVATGRSCDLKTKKVSYNEYLKNYAKHDVEHSSKYPPKERGPSK